VLQFTPMILDASNIEVSSSSVFNGAEKVTLTYKIILGNPLPPRSIVHLYLPKQNYWFTNLGAPTRQSFLLDEDFDDFKVEVSSAVSKSATSSTPVTIGLIYLDPSFDDPTIDIVTIQLETT
jgi:hypothetical protein